MNNDMEKYFVNPDNMDMDPFIEQFKNLNNKVQRFVNLDSARVDSKITKTYAQLLESENLTQKGEGIDNIFETLAEYSQGLIRWTHPGALINVNPPLRRVLLMVKLSVVRTRRNEFDYKRKAGGRTPVRSSSQLTRISKQ